MKKTWKIVNNRKNRENNYKPSANLSQTALKSFRCNASKICSRKLWYWMAYAQWSPLLCCLDRDQTSRFRPWLQQSTNMYLFHLFFKKYFQEVVASREKDRFRVWDLQFILEQKCCMNSIYVWEVCVVFRLDKHCLKKLLTLSNIWLFSCHFTSGRVFITYLVAILIGTELNCWKHKDKIFSSILHIWRGSVSYFVIKIFWEFENT